MADLADVLAGMTVAELDGWVAGITDPADLDLVERALARVQAVGWRGTPATMAHHLTGGDYKRWRFVDLIADRIAGAWRGDRSRFQAVNIPSQYGKTTLLANWTPLWLLDQDPTLRIMYVSYDADKAVEEGGKARDLAARHADDLGFELRPDRRARGMWGTPQGGGFYAVGLNGAITGFPADVLLLDDLIKGWVEAHSAAVRNAVWSIYVSQIRMRSQGARTMIVAAGTRWHEADFFARLRTRMDEDPDADRFEFLRLAAVAEPPDPTNRDPLLREPDPLGRAVGEVLEPLRFDDREVRARRAALGSYLWSAVEQQRPAPEEGGEIPRGWWRRSSTFPTRYDDSCTSWDMKLKDREAGDYTVGQVWGRTGGRYWLVDQVRGQWPQAAARLAVALLQVRHPWVARHYVENAGYGPEVIEGLRAGEPDYQVSDAMADLLGMTSDERPQVERLVRRGLSNVIAVTPKGPKPVRLRAQTGKIEAGNVVLPDGRDFADAVIDEAAAFPNGAHDDQLDALSQALAKLSRGVGSKVQVPRGAVARPTPGGRPPTTVRR